MLSASRTTSYDAHWVWLSRQRMSKKFYLGANTVEDVTFLKVSGVVDEDNSLARSLKKIDGKTVIIDLSEITRINSCGVRDWVNWLNDLNAKGKQVILVRCSPCIVNQINLVNNFVGSGMVKSFFAPYYCPKCDIEQQKLLQVESFASMKLPAAPDSRGDGCNEAQCQMEFDDIEEAYVAFIPRNTGSVVDTKLTGHIESLSPTIRDRIKRLDTVERDEDTGRTPVSGMYSPLTVTTGVSMSRDSLNQIGPPQPEGSATAAGGGLGAVLTGLAFVLFAAIIGYVLFVSGR